MKTTTSYKVSGLRPPSGYHFTETMTGEDARNKIERRWNDGDYDLPKGFAKWSSKKLVRFWADEVMELRDVEITRA